MNTHKLLFLLGLILPLASAAGAVAAQTIERAAPSAGPSGQPLPRFVSLDADKANLRTGPNKRFPILWVYTRPGWPFLVTGENGVWRRVRDREGVEGWMHVGLLSSRRTAVVTGDWRVLTAKPAPDSRPVMRAEPGVIGRLDRCRDGRCRLSIEGRSGWLGQEEFWGAFTDEELD